MGIGEAPRRAFASIAGKGPQLTGTGGNRLWPGRPAEVLASNASGARGTTLANGRATVTAKGTTVTTNGTTVTGKGATVVTTGPTVATDGRNRHHHEPNCHRGGRNRHRHSPTLTAQAQPSPPRA
jgi:hypothetical protein